MKELIDLSHSIEDGMTTYRGLPPPRITEHLGREESRKFYAAGTEFHIGRIEMVANTGTYLDSPFHRYADGEDLSELPLASLANLEALTVRVPKENGRRIDSNFFRGLELRGRAVLVHTGWASRWGTENYFEGHPYLSADAAAHLADAGATLVGIDSYNIDDTADLARPAHSILLRAAVPVVEHLCNLESLPAGGYRFFAVPVKIRGFGTFPVRAFGLIE
ncbi:MAG TPA: cyclase family protein [Pyrinomonadaceae bacterium]|jgi:kynurenine formamidase|nr:cyclase family protein [Pyrinomonadaceae bacterium]